MKLKRFFAGLLTVTVLGASLFMGCATNDGSNGQSEPEAPPSGPSDPGGDPQAPPVTPATEDIVFKKTYDGKTVDACTAHVRNFINNRQNEKYAAETLNYMDSHQLDFDRQTFKFEWKDNTTDKNSSYTLYIADNQAFQNAFSVTTTTTGIDNIAYFVPGKTYYYKVVGNVEGSSKTDSFTVKDLPVRYLTAGSMRNVRDLGGWTTTTGKKIRYNKVFRGGATDETQSHIDNTAKSVFNYLGMQYEIDFRGNTTLTANTWNDRENRFKVITGLTMYSLLDPNTRDKLIEGFAIFSDEANYPVYMHCSGGADRTGGYAFVLGALLGMSYEDLRYDYELTSYSCYGVRARTDIIPDPAGGYKFSPESTSSGFNVFDYGYKLIMNNYGKGGKSLQQAMEEYLLDFGVTEQQISAFKSIMLQD